jgi:hypothetical protein
MSSMSHRVQTFAQSGASKMNRENKQPMYEQFRSKIWTLNGFSLEKHPLGTTLCEWNVGAKTWLKWPENSSHFRQAGLR